MPTVLKGKKATKASKTTQRRTPVAPAPEPQAEQKEGYAIGAQVVHPMFGDGTVTAIEGGTLTIRFRKGCTRQIVDVFVKPRA